MSFPPRPPSEAEPGSRGHPGFQATYTRTRAAAWSGGGGAELGTRAFGRVCRLQPAMTRSPLAARDRRTEFEATAVPFMRPLYHTALRLIHKPEDASDIVQETFLRAYRTFDNFVPGTNAKAWLFTILYSVFANRYRKERREPESVPLHEIEDRFVDKMREGAGPDSAARLLDEAPDEFVESALRDLPESFRSAVLLVDVEELSYDEAAAALGCPIGTLRSRLFRGRKLLFVRLHEHARKTGYLRRS